MGTDEEIPVNERHLYFIMDRLIHQRMSKMEDFLDAGGVVICDRYMYSNCIHQAPDREELNCEDKDIEDAILREYMREGVDYEVSLGVIPASVRIYLRMSPIHSMESLTARGEELDQIESRGIVGATESFLAGEMMAMEFGFKTVMTHGANGRKTEQELHGDIMTRLLEE